MPSWDAPEPAEALDWFRSKVLLSKDEFETLSARAKQKAFTVAGLADLDMVSDAWRAIDSAVADGTTLEDFRDTIGQKLEEAWGHEDGFRLETIFRTNTQQAYNAGRYLQAQTEEAKASHPFYRFDAILDSRTTDICGDLDGTVLRKDDDFWGTHHPALHFNCRSHLTELTEADAKEEGTDQTPPASSPLAADGFGAPPTESPSPDLSSRPEELAYLYSLKNHT